MARISAHLAFLVTCVVLTFSSFRPAVAQMGPCGCEICDLDGDGDVDQSDFGNLQTCLTGFSGTTVPDCLLADLNGNGTVDPADLETFLACAAGPDLAVEAGEFDGLFITELMASNSGTLTDEDGDESDWLEIHNPCRPVVNLDGWYLTDDPGDLTKWRFPAVQIRKGEFLIVFNSDKDRNDPTKPLHTNFKLSSDGDFVALVRPDGHTIVHSYQPTYPEQLSDISYGLVESAELLIAPGAQARYRVLSGDDGLGTAWTEPDFVDTTWSSGATGLGFSSVEPFFNVSFYKANVMVGNLAVAESVVAEPSKRAWTVTEQAAVINYLDNDSEGHFPTNSPFPGLQFGSGTDDFVVLATATIVVPTPGEWSFGVNSDDGFSLRLSRGGQVYETSYPEPRGASDTISVFDLLEAGTYDVRLVYYERSGGAAVELFAAQGSYFSFDQNAFHLVGDTAAGGLGVGVLGGTISTDISAEMRPTNASVRVRVPFEVADPAVFNFLSLRMRYEDGFAAFLNGHEVARRNAPEPVRWNSASASDRPLSQATDAEEINLTEFLGYLRPGTNVLAVQGLNDTSRNADLLILPELVAGQHTLDAQYFITPTPGTYNSGGNVDFIRKLNFSVEHGFFQTPFQLAITTPTPGVQIRYTLNGSTQTESNGTLYGGPITINRTSVVRAAAFRPGYLSSEVETRTYLFIADVLTQSPAGYVPGPGWPANGEVNGIQMNYGMDPSILNDPRYAGLVDDALLDIPSVSLVTDLPNLFDPIYGIYANPGGDGRGWERPASLELLNPDGSEGFAVNAGMRIRGGYSRSTGNPKHAFRFFFRSEYGAGKLNFPLFGSEGAEEFDKVDLATAQNYSWSFEYGEKNTFLRDMFSRDSQRDQGRPYTRSRYYHLYINGVYWGLYYTQERSEANYAETYFGGTEDDYDVVKVEAGPYTIYATDGNLDAWYRLWTIVEAGVTDEVYQQTLGNYPDGTRNPEYEVLVDADNLIDYIINTIFVGDPDGPVAWGGDFPNNFYAVRNRNGLTGFRFFRHDGEHSMGAATGDIYENRTGPYVAGQSFDRFNPFRLHQRLSECEDYRVRFMDHAYQQLTNGGVFTPQATRARMIARRDEIDLAIIAESARWGDSKGEPPRNKDNHWLPAVNWILDSYLPVRTDIVTQQLIAKSLFKTAPALSPAGGSVPAGTQVVLAYPPDGTGTIYYTLDGTDPRLPGGGVSPQALTYEQSTTTETLVAKGAVWRYLDDGSNQGTAWYAAAFNDGAWKSGQAELGYGDGGETTTVSYGPNSSDKYPTTYFRKTFNVPAGRIYTGLTMGLRYDDGAVVYVNGQQATNPINMPGSWGYRTYASGIVGGTDETTYFAYELDTDLLHAGQNVIAVEIHQGSGDSSDISFDLELTGTWSFTSDPIIVNQNTRIKTRLLDGDGWSAMNQADYIVGPVPLYINELVASNSGGLEDPDEPGEYPDWFELHNPNGFAVDVSGLHVTDDLGEPDKWQLGDGLIIPAGGFLILYADDDVSQGSTHVGFKLSNDGESVGLYDRDGVTPIDTVSFGRLSSNVAYGRYPDGTGPWAIRPAATPGGPNAQ